MTEKEFENLKIGDKVWIYHGFLSEAFVVSKQDNWIEFKADSLLPMKFSYRYVGITKSQALEGEIEIQKKYVDVAETELGQKQATLSALKAELAKAKEEESVWVVINEKVYKETPYISFPSSGFQRYPTEQEAYSALADFYKAKYEEALSKAGKTMWYIAFDDSIVMITNAHLREGCICEGVNYDGNIEERRYNCHSLFSSRQEAELELKRRKKND